MKISTIAARQTLSFLATSLGLFVALGWFFHSEPMVRILPDSVAMGLNTALLFIAAAIGLLPSIQQPIFQRIQTICGWALILLPCAILFEHWRDISIGIDWTALHSLVKDG